MLDHMTQADDLSQDFASPPLPLLRMSLLCGALSAIGGALVVPYLAVLFPEVREAPVPLIGLAALQGIQAGVLSTGLAYVGLRCGRLVGLGAPWLAARLGGRQLQKRPMFVRAAVIGFVGGLLVLAIDTLGFAPHLPVPIEQIPRPGPLDGLLASFYGGVTEEVLSRLFLVSALSWLGVKGLHLPRAIAVNFAIVLAALAFGAAHLPAAFQIIAPTGFVAMRTIVLNMLLGIPFGLMFVRRGLAHAIVMHFAADIALHVAGPVLLEALS